MGTRIRFTLIALLGGLLLYWVSVREKFPPPVTVTLSVSNTPVRVFPGVTGVFLVLPDGTLWRWGQTGGTFFSRARVPEQVGTNRNWVHAFAANNHCVGRRADGTIWEWGWRGGGKRSPEPEQVGPGTNWVDVAAGDVHSLALDQEGHIWGWGDNTHSQLGAGPANVSEPREMGIGAGWKSLAGGSVASYALKEDGSVWVWGSDYVTTLPGPTRFGKETNWVDLRQGPVPLVRGRTGDWWQVWYNFTALNSMAELSSIALRVGREPEPEPGQSFAQAYVGKPQAYERRADGTLWTAPMTFVAPGVGGGAYRARTGDWKRFGKRSDWIAIWGHGTVIGLTADGTVWTWGTDLGSEPVLTLQSQFARFRNRFLDVLGLPAPSTTTAATPGYAKNPRALLKIHYPGQMAPSK